uniref:PIN domain protein n=1 Tax=uncultured bacterium contig00036 TaxID=1181524 RepID=A0A806K0X6_9BACT|nr:PIN domain protein [uncultured bacterium contig00036]
MNVIDSSLWMEYFLGNDIDFSIRSAIVNIDSLIVPTICVYEVYRKMLTEKDSSVAYVLAGIMRKGKIVDITCDIALLAAGLSKQHGLPMADSIIYATAKINNAILWTQDQHFRHLDAVNYFPKFSI